VIFFGYAEVSNRDVLVDLEKLIEYLKCAWRVMITYDVVIRDAGGDPRWEKECDFAFRYMLGVTI
jgi:hypothetical protein